MRQYLAILLSICTLTSCSLAEKETATYATRGEKNLLVDIYGANPELAKKPNAERNPAVLCIHGGGWEWGSKDDCELIAKSLAQKGYTVFAINYRLADVGGINPWPAQLDDSQTAVRWIRHNADKYGIDPNRIAASGASSGGHLAALLGLIDTRKNQTPALAPYSSKVNCVVSYAGPTDLTKDFRKIPYQGKRTIQDILDQLFNAKYPAYSTVAKQASPLFNINKTAAPHLLIHGLSDKIIAPSQSKNYQAALTKNGIPCETYYVPNTPHIITNPITLFLVANRLTAYLDQQLKPAEKATAYSPLP